MVFGSCVVVFAIMRPEISSQLGAVPRNNFSIESSLSSIEREEMVEKINFRINSGKGETSCSVDLGRIATNRLRHHFDVPTASPLNSRSCCHWSLLSCTFGDDISEQPEAQMGRGCVKKLKWF
jgi:hypothetical protein